MSHFLQNHWNDIQPDIPEGYTTHDIVAEGFLFPWNHDNANMDMIQKALKILKPKIVIELGTFEGFGSEKIATTMSEYSFIQSKFYTFDVGERPFNSLGPTYGVPETEKTVDWQNIKGWESWGKVIEARKKRLGADYPNVKVEFIPGLTSDSLPATMPRISKFDFCYQDTVHHPTQVIEEWKLFRDYTHEGSIVVFDDIIEGHDFIDWFAENERDWIFKHTTIGHQQLWTEKIA